MDARRALPSVDALLRHPTVQTLLHTYARDAVTRLVRQALEAARSDATPIPSPDVLAERVAAEVRQRWRSGPQAVVNATGVILHTNLGRAPLSRAAAEAGMVAALGYGALEFDLERGTRGSRYDHLTGLLREVTGAEDGVAVNNNAAALVLVLSALCRRREVVVSRGQAVEIGGGFRIPAIMRESGARLVEVGTTNKTRVSDYVEALSERTAAILRVHASNFKVIGFTEEVGIEALAAAAHAHGVALLDDVGSGSLLDVRPYGLAPEPLVQGSVAAGVDLVLFSGDKLLGGPQAGLIVGRADLVARVRRHPLMRALRPDKVTIAALGATLLHYVRDEAEREIPVWRMIAAPLDALESRAARWRDALALPDGVVASVEPAQSTIGGGSLPGETLPTRVLALQSTGRASSWASETAARLRTAPTPVVARIEAGCVLLDPRTVLPDQDAAVVQALDEALSFQPSAASMLMTRSDVGLPSGS